MGLYNYVRELTSVNPIDRQIEAMQALAAHGKLPSGAKVTLVQVDQHANGLLAKWLDVQRPDATPDVLDFRTRLGTVEEANEVASGVQEQTALTPGYRWVQDTPISTADATPASAGPQVIAKQAAELRHMQEQEVARPSRR